MRKSVFIIIIIIAILGILLGGYVLLNNDNKIIINFNTNSETKLSSVEIKKGDSINLPSLERDGYEFLGWYIDDEKIDNNYKFDKLTYLNAKWQKNEVISAEEESHIDNKLTLSIDMSNIDSIHNNESMINCEKISNGTCTVRIPLFNKKGYISLGYSENKNDNKATIEFGDSYVLSSNKTIYPVYETFPNKKTVNIKSDVELNNLYVDIGDNCPSNIANTYIEYLREIYNKWPFLFHNQKVMLLNESEFIKFSNATPDVLSVSFPYNDLTPIVVSCSNNFYEDQDGYLIFVHELIHSIDEVYKYMYKNRLSSGNNIEELYNKYKKLESNRPLSPFAFSNGNMYDSKIEFFAELMAFYYLNYVDTNYNVKSKNYYRGNYPNDMRLVAEQSLDLLNCLNGCGEGKSSVGMHGAAKPIIYLYPEKESDVIVKLGNIEDVTTIYPKYNNGWKEIAKQNGTLIDKNTGRSLYSLYWEGKNYPSSVTNEGFVIKGEDTSEFLEEKLEILGLNEREAEEFIIYWLPQMEHNKYNYIKFTERSVIDKYMPLEINPKPDTLIRVMMEFKPLTEKVSVKEQKLEKAERKGFTAVEWGGSLINSDLNKAR